MSQYQSIVALYGTAGAAESARSALIEAGIPASDITIRAKEDAGGAATTAGTTTTTESREPGFWEWLFGTDYETIPEDHRSAYYSGVERGHTLLTVRAIDLRDEYLRVSEILEGHGATDLDDSGVEFASYDAWADDGRTSTAAAYGGIGGVSDPVGTDGTYRAPGTATAGTTAGATDRTTTEEEVIPIAKEELDVGKRTVRSAKAYRVRSTVTEVPVEETVSLKDETVTVEKRGASGVTGSGDPFTDRVVEVHESHEEPVVTKTSHVDEEVVVRKDTDHHTETVRDTVRETHVDIDKDATPTDKDRI